MGSRQLVQIHEVHGLTRELPPNLACGRRALFVSDKMAALEVVFRRLQNRGLGQFCLERHSSKANKRAVLDQLAAPWNGANERTVVDWTKRADALRGVRAYLNGLVNVLHAPGPAGISPRDATGRVARWSDIDMVTLDWGADLARPDRAPIAEALDGLFECAKRLGHAFSRVTAEDRALFAAVEQDEWSYAWATRATTAARDFTAAL